jgi:hypothetical protein
MLFKHLLILAVCVTFHFNKLMWFSNKTGFESFSQYWVSQDRHNFKISKIFFIFSIALIPTYVFIDNVYIYSTIVGSVIAIHGFRMLYEFNKLQG